MLAWFLILVSIFISAVVGSLFRSKSSNEFPPGPPTIPFITGFLNLRIPQTNLGPLLGRLHAKYGPIVTLQIGSCPSIFIIDRSIAHKALIQNAALFACRPLPNHSSARRNVGGIGDSPYGPIWSILRRNLTIGILNPVRIRSYAAARRWVLNNLANRLIFQSQSFTKSVYVQENFSHAMCSLLVLMCFGSKLDAKQIDEIEEAQKNLVRSFKLAEFLNRWPIVPKIFFRQRWKELGEIRTRYSQVLFPLIEARKKAKQAGLTTEDEDKTQSEGEETTVAYFDTLLDLEIIVGDEKRKLETSEIVGLCTEFLIAGTDTTSTTLQWIMANLVKYPHIRDKVYGEMKANLENGQEEVKQGDLRKLPYLKAVILEALRRHPPGFFLFPHSVSEDTVLEGTPIPKNANINFCVGELGRDPEVWEDPMAFKPERFFNGEEVQFDITSSKEIKMLPFGAGKRMCAGFTLALLHLEYFVANLMWRFEWKAAAGDDVDLSEVQMFTMVMKKPLQAQIKTRF